MKPVKAWAIVKRDGSSYRVIGRPDENRVDISRWADIDEKVIRIEIREVKPKRRTK